MSCNKGLKATIHSGTAKHFNILDHFFGTETIIVNKKRKSKGIFDPEHFSKDRYDESTPALNGSGNPDNRSPRY
jgi:hypothetical protein